METVQVNEHIQKIHTGKLNLKMAPWKKRFFWKTGFFRFHMNFQRCKLYTRAENLLNLLAICATHLRCVAQSRFLKACHSIIAATKLVQVRSAKVAKVAYFILWYIPETTKGPSENTILKLFVICKNKRKPINSKVCKVWCPVCRFLEKAWWLYKNLSQDLDLNKFTPKFQ